jgi:hypothetical protein
LCTQGWQTPKPRESPRYVVVEEANRALCLR